jgi:hypothetical protein
MIISLHSHHFMSNTIPALSLSVQPPCLDRRRDGNRRFPAWHRAGRHRALEDEVYIPGVYPGD